MNELGETQINDCVASIYKDVMCMVYNLFCYLIVFFCLSSSIQPCTEVLFLDIFHNYSQTLTPVLLDMVQNLQGQLNGHSRIITYKKKS